MNDTQQRQHVIDTARALRDSGLTVGTTGNVSVRRGEGFLITPTGVDYDALTPEHIAWVDADGQAHGPFQPSSEWPMHAGIYHQKPDVHALVHTHSRHATAMACNREHIPPFHYMVAVAGGADIPCAGYAAFGTRLLADYVVHALEDRKACLMANHGQIATGRTLDEALSLAHHVEELAAQYLLALQHGDVHLLSDEEMATVIERFHGYGQPQPKEPDPT